MNELMRTAIGGAFVAFAAISNAALAQSHLNQAGWHNNRHSHWNLRYGYIHAPYSGYRYKYAPYYGYGYYPYSYGYFPYGGFVGAYLPDYYAVDDFPVGTVTVTPPIMNMAPSPIGPHCKHSEETKTVPSEDGGEKQIRITRC